ncbi:hypothetical protein F4808DRAFT_462634 [Astrocystis sublimbata]|nr:hypothetical protein F4808DRAFT_462634 [Astrocystis sublimbata]
MPQSTSAANSTSEDQTRQVADDEGPIIPEATATCLTWKNLTQQNFLAAKARFVAWDHRGKTVSPGMWHAEIYPYPDTEDGVAWYICNCKWVHPDHARQWELDQVQEMLEKKCGAWNSGTVLSEKWQKTYAIVPSPWFRKNSHYHENLCPDHCAKPL